MLKTLKHLLLIPVFVALSGASALAAETCSELKSKQLCYVWAGTRTGQYITRKDAIFTLISSTCQSRVSSVYKTEIAIDAHTIASIGADWDNYYLSLRDRRDPDPNRSLESATFKRTGIWGDYLGFTTNTLTGTYSIACSSIDN